MQLVLAIEEGRAPEKIIAKYSVDNALKFMASVGAEIIILGCTHFPYIEEEIKKISELPIFSPSEQMCQNILDKLPE